MDRPAVLEPFGARSSVLDALRGHLEPVTLDPLEGATYEDLVELEDVKVGIKKGMFSS
jgi:hypothetical protein